MTSSIRFKEGRERDAQEAILKDHSASSLQQEALGCGSPGPHPVQAARTRGQEAPSKSSCDLLWPPSPPLPKRTSSRIYPWSSIRTHAS